MSGNTARILRYMLPFLVLVLVAFAPPITQLSMKLTTRVVKKGKSVTSSGELYYKSSNGNMVTRFISPQEYLVMTNATGEFSVYNSADNTVSQAQGRDYSSENSFVYFFLRNKTFDMGLGASGFRLRNTRFEENMTITTWDPPIEMAGSLSKAELVQENNRPIFMGFFNSEGKPTQKVYYSKYEQIGDLRIPTTITEIQFEAKGDSSITKRMYSDIRINDQVDTQWLNFRIPTNAKVLK